MISTLGVGERYFQKKKIYPGRQKINNCPVYLLYLLCLLLHFHFYLSIFSMFHEIFFKFAPYVIYLGFRKVVISLPHFLDDHLFIHFKKYLFMYLIYLAV